MLALLIGISSGLLTILIVRQFKRPDEQVIYGLILASIGFLYVGYTWSDTRFLVINSIQAVFFLFMAMLGIRRNSTFLIAGYFLHGSWDLAYDLFPATGLLPPHYDLFCLSIDFTIAFYLLIIKTGKGKLSFNR